MTLLGSQVLQDLDASHGDPRDLLPAQITALRELLNQDLMTFCYVIVGARDLHEPLHRPVCEIVERWGEGDWKRLMVQLPRGSFKSTLITIGGSLWRLCRDPNATVAIFNEKLDNAKRFVGAIEQIVRSSHLFRALYRDLIPPGVGAGDRRTTPKSWPFNPERLLFVRDHFQDPEPSIMAFGVGGASAGHHFQWTVKDDLISNEAASSPTVMQSVKDWFDTSLYLGMSPETLNDLVVCTRWHYDDVYEYAREEHGYRLYRRSALENGQSIFPAKWSTESLVEHQARNPYDFSTQMQNDPMAGKDQSFSRDWYRPFTLHPSDGEEWAVIDRSAYDPTISELEDEEPPRRVRLSQMQKTVLVDPAPVDATEKRDQPRARAAIVVKGIDPWGRRFLLDAWAGREETLTFCRRMLRTLETWGTHRLGIEEVVFSKVYAPFLRYMARREFPDLELHYIALKPGRREKDQRIAKLANAYQGGWEYIHQPVMALHQEEYLTWPHSRTRDILDAESYGLDPGVLQRPESEWEEDLRVEAEWVADQERGPTGYGDGMEVA